MTILAAGAFIEAMLDLEDKKVKEGEQSNILKIVDHMRSKNIDLADSEALKKEIEAQTKHSEKDLSTQSAKLILYISVFTKFSESYELAKRALDRDDYEEFFSTFLACPDIVAKTIQSGQASHLVGADEIMVLASAGLIDFKNKNSEAFLRISTIFDKIDEDYLRKNSEISTALELMGIREGSFSYHLTCAITFIKAAKSVEAADQTNVSTIVIDEEKQKKINAAFVKLIIKEVKGSALISCLRKGYEWGGYPQLVLDTIWDEIENTKEVVITEIVTNKELIMQDMFGLKYAYAEIIPQKTKEGITAILTKIGEKDSVLKMHIKYIDDIKNGKPNAKITNNDYNEIIKIYPDLIGKGGHLARVSTAAAKKFNSRFYNLFRPLRKFKFGRSLGVLLFGTSHGDNITSLEAPFTAETKEARQRILQAIEDNDVSIQKLVRGINDSATPVQLARLLTESDSGLRKKLPQEETIWHKLTLDPKFNKELVPALAQICWDKKLDVAHTLEQLKFYSYNSISEEYYFDEDKIKNLFDNHPKKENIERYLNELKNIKPDAKNAKAKVKATVAKIMMLFKNCPKEEERTNEEITRKIMGFLKVKFDHKFDQELYSKKQQALVIHLERLIKEANCESISTLVQSIINPDKNITDNQKKAFYQAIAQSDSVLAKLFNHQDKEQLLENPLFLDAVFEYANPDILANLYPDFILDKLLASNFWTRLFEIKDEAIAVNIFNNENFIAKVNSNLSKLENVNFAIINETLYFKVNEQVNVEVPQAIITQLEKSSELDSLKQTHLALASYFKPKSNTGNQRAFPKPEPARGYPNNVKLNPVEDPVKITDNRFTPAPYKC